MAATVKIVRAPAPIVRIQPPRFERFRARAKHLARGFGRAAMAQARDEKHTFAAVTAGVVLGLAERNNVTLPHIAALGTAGTYGVLAWAVGKWGKSRMARHAASGLLAIAGYQHAKGGTVSGSLLG